jgi:hypothetical protein
MTFDDALLSHATALRIPVDQANTPGDWKEWYHFVLLDLDRGTRVLANVSVSGNTQAGEIQVTLAATFRKDDSAVLETYGSAASHEWRQGMVSAAPLRIRAEDLSLSFARGSFQLEAQDARAQLALAIDVQPASEPLMVTAGSPFGSGFIGWGIVPEAKASGRLHACRQVHAIDARWFCYHDHNFGRFLWGEDIGWEWLVAHARTEDDRAISAVVDLRTDRSHRHGGLPYVFVYLEGKLRKVFLGASLKLTWAWNEVATLPPRLPGAMASLFADRTARQPMGVSIDAVDERDSFTLQLTIDAMYELVVPDNRGGRYTRIAEVSGPVDVSLTWRGHAASGKGLAYGEYTH